MITILILGILVHSITRDLTAAWTGTGLNPFQAIVSRADGDGQPSLDPHAGIEPFEELHESHGEPGETSRSG